MPTITTVDATWTNGVAMDEAELRRADSAMFLGDGSNNGVRGGIVRHGDNSLAVSVNGSDQVTVQSGAAVIPAATGLGVYRAALSAATSAVGISSRNATNPRIDLVVMQIESGAAVVKTVDGTPGASPSAPALPANAVELGRLNVPALGGGAVTVDNNFRAYAAALGGTLHVATAARLPGSGNQKGQRAIALDTGFVHTWDGSAWGFREGVWQAYTPTPSGFTTSSVTARYTQIGKTVHVTYRGVISVVSGGMSVALPVAAQSVNAGSTGTAVAGDVGTSNVIGAVGLATASSVWFIAAGGTTNVFGLGTPFDWAPGDTLAFSFTYEAA